MDINALTGELMSTELLRSGSSRNSFPLTKYAQSVLLFAWLYHEGRLEVKVAIPYRNNLPVSRARASRSPFSTLNTATSSMMRGSNRL